jgi:sulfur relay (sulfurtransferase) DsrC/TusE family protein
MKYEDIKDFYERCDKHPDHQNGMISYRMIERRLEEEIEELREYIEQRQWVGLTDEEIKSLPNWWPSYEDAPALIQLVKDVEARLKEKNGGSQI